MLSRDGHGLDQPVALPVLGNQREAGRDPALNGRPAAGLPSDEDLAAGGCAACP